jgi:hypothetical protein
MTLDQAEDILGPGTPHPAIQLKGPDLDGYPYSWGSLKLSVTKKTISGIATFLWAGSTPTLPTAVLPGSKSYSATIVREDLIAALDAADCRYEVEPMLTFGGQSSIRTQPADVCAVFSTPGKDNDVPDRDKQYLLAIHKHVA